MHSHRINTTNNAYKVLNSPWKEFIFVVLVGLINLFAGMIYSLQAPIYPSEAESKGLSTTEYGFVFGFYEVFSFIMCPFVKNISDKIGRKKSFTGFLFLAGVSTIAFGFIHEIPVNSGQLFFWISILLRFFESIGTIIGCLTLVDLGTDYCLDSLPRFLSLVQAALGLGMSIGPTFGGILYEYGGFLLPFIVVGAALILLNILINVHLSLNFESEGASGNLQRTGQEVSFLSTIRIPYVLSTFLYTIVASFSFAFTFTILEPEIRVFNLSHTTIGLVFLTYSGTYAISTSIIGYLISKFGIDKNLMWFSVIGLAEMGVGYLLLGPAYFIGIPKKLHLAVIGLAITGLGQSAVNVSTLLDTVYIAKTYGIHTDGSSTGVLSSIYLMSMNFGCIIAPPIAGALMDTYGSDRANVAVLVISFIFSITCAVYINVRKLPVDSEAEKLLSNGG